MGRDVPAYSPDLILLLSTYSFPGNVRELENMVEYGLRKSKTGTLSIKPFRDRMQIKEHPAAIDIIDASGNRKIFVYQGDLETLLADIEREYIIKVLKEAKGNKSRASESLGMDIHKLKRRLKKFRME
ncbi:MAG: hypothetical protein JXB88_10670 [Spirochaetales bacterium]|nr:hypothetical protein [Spirochaetales bacterium]